MKNATLVGKMVRDPVEGSWQNTTVVNFTVGVRDGYKKKTEFFKCCAFGKTAEFIAQYFKDGQPISVNGDLGFDEWQDKETGKKRKAIKLTVSSCTFTPKDTSTTEETTTDADLGNLPAADVPF